MGHLLSGTQLNVNAIRRRYFPNRVIKMIFIAVIKVAARFLFTETHGGECRFHIPLASARRPSRTFDSCTSEDPELALNV